MMRSVLDGERVWGWTGHIIDTLAVFATLFGLATSLGFGTQQALAGLNHLFDIPTGNVAKVVLIGLITGAALISVLRGLDGGLRSIVDDYDPDATMRSEGIRIHKKSQIYVDTRLINLAGKPMGQLRQHVDASKYYRLFGRDIILDEPVLLTKDPVFFNPVRVSGKNLTMEFAMLEDLDPVKNAVVEQGKILVRYHLKPWEVLDSETSPEVPWEIVEFAVDELTEVKVVRGDSVATGGLIAVRGKYVKRMELNEQEQRNVQAKIRALRDLDKEAQANFTSQKAFLKSRIQAAEKDLKNHQMMLGKNIVAQQEVLKKTQAVRSLQADLQRLTFEGEQQAARSQEQLAELKLTLQRLRTAFSDIREQAYIYVRTDGKIREIVSAQKNGEITVKLFIEPPERKEVK